MNGSQDKKERPTLHLGCCIEYMRTMLGEAIDLTVTSPPYDNLRNYNGTLDWGWWKFQQVARELYRVTKNGGVVVWVVGDATTKGSESGSSFRQALYFMEVGFNLHDTMIYKSAKPPLTHNRYEQCFEYMFVFSKGRPQVFNPLKVQSKYANTKRCATMRQDGEKLGSRSANGKVQSYKIKENIFEYVTGNNKGTKDKIAFNHPATFPDQLPIDHVSSWTNAGGIVFDPFAGSGTTGKAALSLGRQFIGCEIVPEYYEIAVERMTFKG